MPSIDTDRLRQIRQEKEGIAVVDVLSAEHFRRRHIPGSLNIPVSAPDFVEKVASAVGGREQPVVIYSAGVECGASEEAAAKLEEAGFHEVYDYVGGMRAWQDAGEPVQAGTRPGHLA
jgi:rhodanese-related sulfurtransferase